MVLYLRTDSEDLRNKSTFYMLLHVIAMLSLINTLSKIYTQDLPKLTAVCIYSVGYYYYYYYYYYYPIVSTSCNVFTDISESEIYQGLRKLLQLLFSCYLSTAGQTHKQT